MMHWVLAAGIPNWAQFILLAAAVVGAVGVLWNKVFMPGFKAASRADRLIDTVNRVDTMLPALTALAAQLGEATELLPVVKAIATEFKSDSGSTLKDQMNAIEAVVAGLQAALRRIEAGDLAVAKNLSVAQQAVDNVAVDLASTHARADKVNGDSFPGAAADAAARLKDPK